MNSMSSVKCQHAMFRAMRSAICKFFAELWAQALSVAWSHTKKPRSCWYSIGIPTLCDSGSFKSDTLQS